MRRRPRKQPHGTAAGRAPPATSARRPDRGRRAWLGCSDSGPEKAGSRQGRGTRSSPGSATEGWIAMGKRLTLGPCLINGDSTCPANILGSL